MVTVLTRTIGPSGRDYASFTLAEADVTNIGTSSDLVANDEAIVFEADAGDYSENLDFNTSGGLTCDPTRNVKWTHATGAGHGGEFESGVNIVGVCNIREDHAVVDGLSVSPSSGGAAGMFGGPEGVIFRNLMAHSPDSYAIRLDGGATAAFPGVVENCVGKSGTSTPFDIRSVGSGLDAHWRVVNCTAMATGIKQGFHVGLSSSDTLNLELVNNVVHGGTARSYFEFAGPTVVVTGSNNFGPDDGSAPFPAALQGSPYPITATTSFSTPLGSGDYAVYMGATGALADVTGNDVWQQGVGPASNSDVPTTDINGVTRSGTSCNPGAFEADGFVDPTVLTRTIGPTGRDFSTFTLAEAAVTSIGSGTDLTFENEAIVFEADAGTYTMPLTASSTLVTDATRNVTYKPAAGSEHGGSAGAGVIIDTGGSNRPITLTDDFTVVQGFNLVTTTTYCAWLEGAGAVAQSCIASAFNRGFIIIGATATDPAEVRNCVSLGGSGFAFYVLSTASQDAHGRIINCTGETTTSNTVFRNQQSGGGTPPEAEFVNCLALSSSTFSESGTVTTTGSNNFGSATNQFPVALQGSPYPVTATTNVSPGVGDFAIYVAETGQLVDSDENDVIYQGVGPSANSDVPATGISGGARYGTTAHPGAFATLFGSPASSPLTSSGFNSAEHLNQLEAEAPWIWLYELQTTDDPPKRYRMTNFTESVEFGMNSSGQPLTYSPTPIIHSDVEEGSDGSLPTITITVGHAGPIVASTVDAANGFVGQPIRIMLVSSLDLSASKAVIRQDGEVVAASITPRGIAFRISAFNLYQLQFPPYIFARRRCRWIFGSAECGYNTDAVGAGFSVCEKTLDACRARGDDEVSLGLPRQHPARFGGWPGIPRAGR